MSENLAIYRNEETRSKLLSGICDRLSSIPKPTLIITGTDDVTSPPANSVPGTKNAGSVAGTNQRRRSWSDVSVSGGI